MSFIDPLRDPRFPNRPQHPDFWRISEILTEQDGATIEGGKSLPEMFAGLADLTSVEYVSGQCAGLFLQRSGRTGMVLSAKIVQAMLQATWLYAFRAGMIFEQRRRKENS